MIRKPKPTIAELEAILANPDQRDIRIQPDGSITAQSFEEALGDLLATYADEDKDTILSALELQVMAVREEWGRE